MNQEEFVLKWQAEESIHDYWGKYIQSKITELAESNFNIKSELFF